jgi:hypothetical protein
MPRKGLALTGSNTALKTRITDMLQRLFRLLPSIFFQKLVPRRRAADLNTEDLWSVIFNGDLEISERDATRRDARPAWRRVAI